MKFDFAVITTDGDEDNLPMPISMLKIEEVAQERATFSSHEDHLMAKWALQINKIMSLR